MNSGAAPSRNPSGPQLRDNIPSPYLTPPATGVGYGRINDHHNHQQMQHALPAELPRGTKRAREHSPEQDDQSSAQKKVKICYTCKDGCSETENFRSTNSNYFGRNKTVTNKIPDVFQAWRCRKAYQRHKYMEDTKLGGSFRSQAESVRETANKIEQWWSRELRADRTLEWEIIMQAGVAKEGSVKSQDPVNRELEKELAKHDLLGNRKTIKQVLRAVDVLVARIPTLQEELRTQPTPDHLKGRALESYKKWLKAADLGKIEFLPQSLDEVWVKDGKRWDTVTGRCER